MNKGSEHSEKKKATTINNQWKKKW